MPILSKAASAPDIPSSKRRFWRRKKSEGKGTMKNRKNPKLMEWRIKGAENFAIAKAHVQERFSHLASWISYQFYAFTHPCNPLRRRAAKRSRAQSNLGATERRFQKEAAARNKSAGKRVRSVEKQMARDAERARLL